MSEPPAHPPAPSSQILSVRSRRAEPLALVNDWRPVFAKEIEQLFQRRLRVAAAVLFVLQAAGFAVFDASTTTPAGTIARIAILPFAAALFAGTWSPKLGRAAPASAALMLIVLAAYIVWNNSLIGHSEDSRALTLAILATLLFPFTARATVAIAAAMLSLYLVIPIATSAFVGSAGIAANAFYPLGAGVIAALGALMSFRLREDEFRARTELETAHAQSETLLHNTLPTTIVARLKRDPGAIAERYAAATVMFVDIVGFTTMSSVLSPDDLVSFLNELFSELDALTSKHGLEKIKTIGDAYMVAGGLPEPRPDHAAAVARMALEMRSLVQGHVTPDGGKLAVRIGIHSGPVVAGVIGTKKLTYDLWGDTVNVASRMESHAEVDTIQVSEATRALLHDEFELRARGTVQIKGKGPMETFVLVGVLPEG